MSYTRILVPNWEPWCLRSESNQRHADFQSAALPTELQRHMRKITLPQTLRCVMATPNGLEPSTSSVTGWRANRLHHRARLYGGNNRARTCDLLLVRQMLSQLSYAPVFARCLPQRRVLLYTRPPHLSRTFFTFFPTNFTGTKPMLSHHFSVIIKYFSEFRQDPPG